MSKTPARYAITTGLSGCYMPNSSYGPCEFTTRGELADAIRAEIDHQEFPKATFGQANIRRLWSAIQHVGSASSYHFTIEHNGNEIAFHGLTEAEAEEMERNNDC